MLNCTIKGCRNSYSEILGLKSIRDRWFVGTADEWPQLRGIHGEFGADKIVLCPTHRKEVFNEILEMRKSQNV